MKRILSQLLERFGDGLLYVGNVLKPKSVVNVVGEENYTPTMLALWWRRERAFRDGISTSPDCLKGRYNPSVKNVTPLKAKRKRKNAPKAVKKEKPWHWPYLRHSDGPEYACRHGIGHGAGVHGCDGCCTGVTFSGAM